MAKTDYVNIEKEISGKYIFVYRLLCAVLMVLIPVFWILTIITSPETKSPILFREILVVASATILIGSYKNK